MAIDEREEGARAQLNFGHTFGHAIEAGTGYGTWLHGEAVATGMVLAARLSRELGYVSDHDVSRIVELLKRAGLPVTPPDLGTERYMELMGHDKKVENGRVRFILLEKLGKAFVTEAPRGPLTRILERTPVHA